MLWIHTIDDKDLIRTHMEAVDWLDRHSKLLDCVRHINDENDKRAITRFFGLGNAASYMYMMASYSTRRTPKRSSTQPPTGWPRPASPGDSG
jgi:hypothetical protein